MSTTDPVSSSSGTTDITRQATESETSFRSIGPYRLLEKLGEGGMGEVWLAEQTHPIRRRVALKVIKAGMDTTQVVARFEAERQALAVMDHPNIAKVLDGGSTTEGRPYFVMEYVRGEAITDYCDRVKMPLRERLELFATLCDGVQHAHHKGIIHRDLKPSNILVSEVGDRPVPRIIDFGIAKATAQRLTDSPMHTEIGSFIGTPEYMSPEQADMTLDVDTRSDVYSLGMILYQLLAGTLPFHPEMLRTRGAEELRRVIREKEPPRPSSRLREVLATPSDGGRNRNLHTSRSASALRGELDWITLKAVEKDRSRRYETANALAGDIRRHLRHEPVEAGRPNAIYKMRKFVRRHQFGVSAVTLVVVLLASFAGAMIVQTQRLRAERDRANREAASAKQVTDFLVSLFSVSDPSQARGQPVTAREVLETGATRIERSLQTEPLVRARLKATMGRVYTGLGFYSEAASMLEESAAVQEGTLGRNHVETLSTLHELANVLWHLQRYSEAEPLYVYVAETRRALLGPEHRDTLKVNYDLASLYIGLPDRWNDAERLALATLETQKRLFGDSDPDTLASINNLAYLYAAQGRHAEADPLYMMALQLRRRAVGEDHPDTLQSMHNAAAAKSRTGDYRQSESLFLQTIELKRRVLGHHHPSTLLSIINLADQYRKELRYTEAEKMLLAAYNESAQSVGAGHRYSRLAANGLAQLYDALKKANLAAEWRAKTTGTTLVR